MIWEKLLEQVWCLRTDVLGSRREALSLPHRPETKLDIIQISDSRILALDESLNGKHLRSTFNHCQASFQQIINREGVELRRQDRRGETRVRIVTMEGGEAPHICYIQGVLARVPST